MENLPNCPKCNSEYTYEDGSLLVCPECAHEWNPSAQEEENVIKDVNGNVLNDGDSVTVVKDLKGHSRRRSDGIDSSYFREHIRDMCCCLVTITSDEFFLFSHTITNY